MNQNTMLIALLIGALFFLRPRPGAQRPVQGQMDSWGATGVPGIPGTTGMYGEG